MVLCLVLKEENLLRLIEAGDDSPAQPVHGDDGAAELARMRKTCVQSY